MKVTKFAAKIFLVIVGVILLHFVYFGATSVPETLRESDSLAYHIPIAKQLASGSFNPPIIPQGLGFYPATAEGILAIFILLHLPLNLFGVLGYALLFYFSKRTAQTFGLSKNMAIIYAGSIVTLLSVLRWPLSQTVDIWQAVFFVVSLQLLRKPVTSTKYFATLGIFNGLLLGAKYSGLPYFIILILVFGLPVFSRLNIKRFLVYLIPVLILGLSWYIRNYLMTGNPLYPANFYFLVGNHDFYRDDTLTWSVLGNIVKNPSFLWEFLVAMISEYLGWAAVFLLPIALIKKKILDKHSSKLVITGLLVLIVFLTLLLAIPIVSNVRYLYPAMCSLMLATFLLIRRKYGERLVAFSIVMATLSLINLDYHPKLIILTFVPVFYFVFINERFNLYNHI